MTNSWSQLRTIAGKEIADARRTSLLFVITLFMLVAGFIALIVAAFALKLDVATYYAAKEALLAIGKPATAIASPDFYPLKLLRGFIEYIEIIGAVLGIVLGYQAAAKERNNQTLALILYRPLNQSTLIGGKILGNVTLIAAVLTLTFAAGALGIMLIAGVTLSGEELAKLVVTDIAAILYVGLFFLLGLLLALSMKRLQHVLLAAFTIWLVLVLIAPQIGDTLDPDNQVAGGVFRTLGIAKPQEIEILKSFKTYETVRDSIEQLSPAKHFERWSFAQTGIKEIYNAQPILAVSLDRRSDLYWLIGLTAALLAALFTRRLDISRYNKE